MNNAQAIVYGDDALRAAGLVGDPPTGSNAAEDCVAVFGADVNLGQSVLADWVTRGGDATTGTFWTIIKRGLYLVEFRINVLASATVFAGVSINALAAQLATDPSIADAQTRDVCRITTPAATRTAGKASALIQVTQRAADTGVAVIRGLLSDGGGTGPAAAALEVAQCSMTITRAIDLNSLS